MERPLLRLILGRLVLATIPFIVYFAWHAWIVRQGREPRVTPWGWLIVAAALLVGLSLIATVVFTPSNYGRTYVPAETRPDGSVVPGHYQ
jgi:hypothetical protein